MSGRPHDAVIVGAGPAGSTLALLLARAGCDVVLIDRAVFPRPKPCGDCLSAEGARLLRRLGLLDTVLALAPARLQGWRIFGPRGACFAAAFAELGDPDPAVHTALALPRERLDAALLQAAADAGADVRCGWLATDVVRERGRVEGVLLRHTDGRELTLPARITVGADGLRSRIARRLGAVRRRARVRKLSFTAHVARPGGGDWFGEMHVGDGVCAGLAPVSAAGDLWNVTLVADADRFGRSATAGPEFFRSALGRLPGLAHFRPGAEDFRPGPDELLASGPFDSPVRPTVFDGAALVGDAAGYFDPFTGQGIYHALAGAALLGQVLSPLLRQGGDAVLSARDLQPYAEGHAALTRGPRRVQRLVHHVLDHPALAERAIAGLARRPQAAAALIAVTGDLRPVRSLLSPALAVSLLLPARRRGGAETMHLWMP